MFLKIKQIFYFFSVCVTASFLFLGCGRSDVKVYRIAMDPSWFPLELAGKEANLFAFMNELMGEIAQRKNVKIERVSVSWDNLIDGMSLDRYDAILSSIQPTVKNANTFAFSDMILPTGPILVVPTHSDVEELQELAGHVLLVSKNSAVIEYMSQYSSVELQFFGYISDALEQVVTEQAAGALIPIIPAYKYLNGIYHEQLKVVGSSLMNEGIRLVVQKGKEEQLMDLFNETLAELQDEGQITALLKKWSLSLRA